MVKKISEKLTFEYGSGYSRSNLERMMKIYTIFNDKEICATLSHKLSWSHFIEFIKIKDELKREFYIAMCSTERWNVRTLRERVNSMLFERTAISKKPEITIRKDLEILTKDNKMSTELFLKDPYLLDFLELQDSFSERDLEISLKNFTYDFNYMIISHISNKNYFLMLNYSKSKKRIEIHFS